MLIWTGLGPLGLGWTGPHLPPPPDFQGARMWRLISVSPVDTIWFKLWNLPSENVDTG